MKWRRVFSDTYLYCIHQHTTYIYTYGPTWKNHGFQDLVQVRLLWKCGWGLDQFKSQQLWYQTHWKVNSVETQLLPGVNLTLRWLRWFCLTKYEVKVTAGRIIPALAMALNGLPLCFFVARWVKMHQNGSNFQDVYESWVFFLPWIEMVFFDLHFFF